MKYLLVFIAIIYQLMLLLCIAMLAIVCSASDWEMGEGFIFVIAFPAVLFFLPLAIWSFLLYRKWPVKHAGLQVAILGGILVALVLGTVYFFAG